MTALPKFVLSTECSAAIDAMPALSELQQSAGEYAEQWLSTFVTMADSSPLPMAVSDMTIPGVPLVFVNGEFESEFGYKKEEVVGRNCRFLQGPKTEPETIQMMVYGLQSAKDCLVKVTNYKKGGEKFQLLLALLPVTDSDGLYHYCVAVQMEAREDGKLAEHLQQMDLLLKLIPRKLGVKSQPTVFTSEDVKMESFKNNAKTDPAWEKKQLKRHKKAMNKFTKIMWMEDTTRTMQQVLDMDQGVSAFMAFLQAEYADAQLRFVVEARKLDSMSGSQQIALAEELCAKYLSASTGGATMKGDAALKLARKEMEQTMSDLASDAFPRFVDSEACAGVMASMQKGSMSDGDVASNSTIGRTGVTMAMHLRDAGGS